MELHSPCLYDHHVGCRLISFLTVIADLHLSLLSLVLVLKLAGVEMQVQPSWPRPLYWVVYPPSATDSFHLFQISLFVFLRPYCLPCCRCKAFFSKSNILLFIPIAAHLLHTLLECSHHDFQIIVTNKDYVFDSLSKSFPVCPGSCIGVSESRTLDIADSRTAATSF